MIDDYTIQDTILEHYCGQCGDLITEPILPGQLGYVFHDVLCPACYATIQDMGRPYIDEPSY